MKIFITIWLIATNTSASDISSKKSCSKFIKSINAADPIFSKLEKIYKGHLSFGGSVHNIIPHKKATYDDLKNAKKELKDEDLPYMIYQVGHETLSKSQRLVPIGVIPMFRLQAIPCLDAALEDTSIKNRVILNQMKALIEINK